jgi:uncharacterized protein (TIGR03067 family)
MQANPLAHPQLEQLSDFALGRLESADVDVIESHLANCPACCDTLNLIKEDTFVGLVRGAKEPGRGASGQPGPAPTDADQASRPIADAATQAAASTPPTGPATEPAVANAPADIPAELANHSRYRIEELLGTGGMGAVYKAQHRLMQRTVALKVINPKFIQSKQAVERFRREVKAAGSLHHSNIVHAYDAEQAGDLHYLVMEYVKGTDLQKVLEQRGPLPVAEACEYIRQAALGLQHAHESGMVHRDIKPQNLMVVSGRVVSGGVVKADDPTTHHSLLTTYQVKILDFGLASLTADAETGDADQISKIDNQKSGLTQVGSLMGTPDYMAPEQAKDPHAADIRSDIYSLGCTLYALLSGKVPFPGGTAMDKVICHSERQPQRIGELRKEVPASVTRVLDKMMAKDPGQRYQSPAEVAAAMSPFTSLGKGARGGERPPQRRWPLGARLVASITVSVLVAGIVWVTTDSGQLKIEAGADIQVEISKDGKVEVIDVKSGTTVKRLASGDYQIKLKGNRTDVRLDSKGGFTITRWGETVVKVSLVPMPPPDLQRAEAERKAAAKIEAATKVAEAYLKLVDQGDYAQCWEQSAQFIHKTISKNDMVRLSEQTLKPLGKLISRTMVGPPRYRTTLPSLPEGEYVLFQYRSQFANAKNMAEVVIPGLEKDGHWRVSVFLVQVQAPQELDNELIRGTWRPVSGEIFGTPVPKEIFDAVKPTMTFSADKIVWKGSPSPEFRKLIEGFAEKAPVPFPKEIATVLTTGVEGVYHLDPTKTPKAFDAFSVGAVRKTLLGIYTLEGDTLKLCIIYDPERVDQRPTEFATKGGVLRALVVLKRDSAGAKTEK